MDSNQDICEAKKMFDLILSLLNTGLQLWLSKEKTKYVDQLMALQKAYYAEYNKPADTRDDSVLDNLTFQLRVLAVAFTVAAAQTPTPAPTGEVV